jgi:asparagine synthase (glutamine-hydrolysing)
MCGIAGFISTDFSRQQLQEMTDCLRYRGPDAEGYFFDEKKGVGLGHRRLSILDLSAAANQPFYSKDGRYSMIFNGEVYNFREVAEKYQIQTVTSSDSEVIIESFAKVGVDCFKDLNGMFAMAIWDNVDDKLYLIRDRIGVKPLYYYHRNNQFAFSSELKGLFLLPVKREINYESVSTFLYLGYIPGDATIYHHFNKLLPGHYAVYQQGMLASYPYWWLDSKIGPVTATNESDAKDQLKQLLQSSVKYCMISDVPVGIFLSGGIDSSIVAAIAQSGSTSPVKTFSIGFKEEKYNEAKFAKKVAKHIGSDHHEFTVTEQDALHLVEKLTDIYDEPYADSSAIPTYMVSQLARSKVTVALSGDGGDELFMGYSFYYWARRLNNPFIKAFRKPIGELLYRLGGNRTKRASYLFRYPSETKRKSHIFSQEQYYFSEAEVRYIVKHQAKVSMDEYICTNKRKLSPEEQQSFFDIKNYLPEELLVKSDRASMQHALEVRVPLLDYRLVEFAMNLPTSLKLKGSTGKYLLKQVLYDYVPATFFDRPKWGFAIPLRIWLRKELSYLIEKYLSPSVVEECDLVQGHAVEEIKKEFFQGRDYLYNRLWVLILLHKWYKEKHL